MNTKHDIYKIIFTSYLFYSLIIINIYPQEVYDTLYRHPDTTTFYNMGITVVVDVTNLAVKYAVDSTWNCFQIEKIIYTHITGIDTNGYTYLYVSTGELPEDSIIYFRKLYLSKPHYPTSKEIVLDTPLVIQGKHNFYLSSGFFFHTLARSQYFQFGIPGQYAFWFTQNQWIEYVPCFFNLKIVVKKLISNLDENSKLIRSFKLSQNYPNPFNSQTKIDFQSEENGVAKLEIFDIIGNKVKSLTKDVNLDGNDNFIINGEQLNSGVYFYQLFINDRWVAAKKMIVLK